MLFSLPKCDVSFFLFRRTLERRRRESRVDDGNGRAKKKNSASKTFVLHRKRKKKKNRALSRFSLARSFLSRSLARFSSRLKRRKKTDKRPLDFDLDLDLPSRTRRRK